MPVTGNKTLISYSLSIRQCADGFSFVVRSLGSGQTLFCEQTKLVQGETMSEALERGLSLPRIKGRRYEGVTLYSSSPSTRIPLDEFRREEIFAIYKLTFAGLHVSPEDIRCQVISELEVVEIFALPRQIEDSLRRHYPSATIQGYYGSMLHQIVQINQGSTLPISFHAITVENGIVLICLRQGTLAFMNVFMAKTDADRLYFLLYVWKTLGLDAWHDSCTLYGVSESFLNDVRQFLGTVSEHEISL